MHKPLHQPAHCDGFPTDSRRQQLQCEAGGSPSHGEHGVIHKAYRRIRNQDSPSDRHGTLLSDIPRQRAYCEQRVVILLSVVLSVPIPWGTLVLPQCLHGTDHVPDCISSYSSLALAE